MLYINTHVYIYIYTFKAVKARAFGHWFNYVYLMCAYNMVDVVSLYSS